MQGLLADINVQGHLAILQQRLTAQDLWKILEGLNLQLATFAEVHLARNINDRELWNFCQSEKWVLFTENRNHEDENSLSATIADSFETGQLPVITLANKRRFETDRDYADLIAREVADILFDIAVFEYQAPPRIYVPR